MSNVLQTGTINMPATVTVPQSTFTHKGDNGIQIANSGTVNVYVHGINKMVYNAAIKLNREYYNLFVVEDEPFHENYFLMAKDRALTVYEGISPEISARFARLTPEAQKLIKTFPSIFASRNHKYGGTDQNHVARYGLVTDIRIQENGIKIYFDPFCSIPQQLLNDLALQLEIQGPSTYNEFNRIHWAIKKVNMIEVLKEAGIILKDGANGTSYIR